jgi:hypothetical protein
MSVKRGHSLPILPSFTFYLSTSLCLSVSLAPSVLPSLSLFSLLSLPSLSLCSPFSLCPVSWLLSVSLPSVSLSPSLSSPDFSALWPIPRRRGHVHAALSVSLSLCLSVSGICFSVSVSVCLSQPPLLPPCLSLTLILAEGGGVFEGGETGPRRSLSASLCFSVSLCLFLSLSVSVYSSLPLSLSLSHRRRAATYSKAAWRVHAASPRRHASRNAMATTADRPRPALQCTSTARPARACAPVRRGEHDGGRRRGHGGRRG